MRNFRTAAVASATALTVALGGMSVASAKESATGDNKNTASASISDDKNDTADNGPKGSAAALSSTSSIRPVNEGDRTPIEVSSQGFKGLSSGQGSSQFFNDTDVKFYITDLLGKETNPDKIPQWFRYWIASTVAAGTATLIGLGITGFTLAQNNGGFQLPPLPQLPQLPQLPKLPF